MGEIDREYMLANRRSFATGNLYAIEGLLTGDLGWLKNHPEWERRYRADASRTDGKITYTVMFYQTPIAWVVEDEHGLPIAAVIPRIDHSVRTRRWQALCRRELPDGAVRIEEI